MTGGWKPAGGSGPHLADPRLRLEIAVDDGDAEAALDTLLRVLAGAGGDVTVTAAEDISDSTTPAAVHAPSTPVPRTWTWRPGQG